MLYDDKENKRRELFLRRFDQTAKVVFVGLAFKKRHDKYAQKLLIELARAALSYPHDTPYFVIRKDLSYVWRAMGKRKKTWSKGIGLVPADFE